jgi:DNA repair exonuclease SbcCD ATPase subunit
MIQTLEIRNRQSHEDTRLDFSPGINLIIGRGTSGKSACLRALRWALENTAGESQISNWIKRTTKGKDPKKVLDGESSVTVTTPKGTLKRFRNTEANGYEINGKTLKAIGTGVPDEVKDFFGISDINIQRQHDLPFLISLPGSQVSAYLNRVVGIEEIDRYLTSSTSCIREAKKAHTALLEAQERDTKALDALGWVDDIQGQLDALDALQAAKGEIEDKLSKLSALRCGLESEGAKLAQARKVADLEPKVQEARKLAQAITGVGSRLSSVARLVQGLEAAKASYAKASRVAGLAVVLQDVEAVRARLEVREAKLQGLQSWALEYRTVKDSLQVASKVAGLSGALEAVRESRRTLEAEEGRLDTLLHLCNAWQTAGIVLDHARKLVALEPTVAKVRRMGRVLEDRRGELASLKHWALTIQGFKDKLESKRSEVSELESKRPERCPLCNGAYGKECG